VSDLCGDKVCCIYIYICIGGGSKNADKYGRVKTWAKDVDIFAKDYLYFPINEFEHWSLVGQSKRYYNHIYVYVYIYLFM